MSSITGALSYVLTGIGRLFYIVSPNSTRFSNYEDVPDYVTESVPFFVLTIFLEFIALLFKDNGQGLKKEQRWNAHKYSVNDMIGSIGAGMLQQISKFFLYNVALLSYLYVYENFRVVTLDPHNIWVWIAGFLMTDLAYYWFHRAAHEVNLFWAAHVVHHSSEYYNQSTALRQSILQTYCSWAFDLPAALFLPPATFAVHKQFNTLFQYWIHTEIIGFLGPLEYIINTPSAHRVHHGRNPYCIDKNYAGTLIIWDIMFGTFELERSESEPVAFGLTHPINTFNPIEVQFHHLKHVLSTFYATPKFSSKIKVLLYGPGWHDGTPRTGLLEEIPTIATDVPPKKYDPSVPHIFNIYVLVHFVLVIIVTSLLMEYQPGELKFPMVCAVSGYILWSLTAFGWVFDQKPHAIGYEILRSITVCVMLQLTKQEVPMLPSLRIGLQVLHAISGLLLYTKQHEFSVSKITNEKMD